jgi:hypothetical protein
MYKYEGMYSHSTVRSILAVSSFNYPASSNRYLLLLPNDGNGFDHTTPLKRERVSTLLSNPALRRSI